MSWSDELPSPKSDSSGPMMRLHISRLTSAHTEAVLHKYFQAYGKVVDVAIRTKKCNDGKRLFFAFVELGETDYTIDEIVKLPHVISGIECNVVKSRNQDSDSGACRKSGQPPRATRKLHVSGIRQSHTDEMLKNYFQEFGKVLDVAIIPHHLRIQNASKSFGFAFIQFEDDRSVQEACLKGSHVIGGVECYVERARCDAKGVAVEKPSVIGEGNGGSDGRSSGNSSRPPCAPNAASSPIESNTANAWARKLPLQKDPVSGVTTPLHASAESSLLASKTFSESTTSFVSPFSVTSNVWQYTPNTSSEGGQWPLKVLIDDAKLQKTQHDFPDLKGLPSFYPIKPVNGLLSESPSTYISKITFQSNGIEDPTTPSQMSDVKFLLDGKSLYFNRSVLACFSPIFREMFCNANFASGSRNQLEISVPNVEFHIFHLFLRCLVPSPSCQNAITEENLVKLLDVAHHYETFSVIEKCAYFILLNWKNDKSKYLKAIQLATKYEMLQVELVFLPLGASLPIAKIKEFRSALPENVYIALLQLKIQQMEDNGRRES